MVLDGERRGLLTPGKTILDATSGNTGIAYAMIGAARGYAVRLCMPEQRHARAQAHPARLRRRTGAHRSDGGLRRRDPRGAPALRRRSGAVLLPGPVQQPGELARALRHDRPGDPGADRRRITHFVAGLGTSGTFMGTGRFFRDHAPHVRLISVQPDTPLHGLEGLKHMESAIVPASTIRRWPTRTSAPAPRTRTRSRGAWRWKRACSSASPAARRCRSACASPRAGRGVVVMIFCDGGEKYLSERFWEEPPEGSFVGGVN